MAAQRSLPGPANRYQVEHTERLCRTFHALTGRDLIDPILSPEAAAEALFHAPFVVLSARRCARSDPDLRQPNHFGTVRTVVGGTDPDALTLDRGSP